MSSTYKFTTNINCGGCVASVSPMLDENEDIRSWTVDTEHPSKILSVTTDSLTQDEIIELITSAGFIATPMKKGLFKGLFNK